MLNSPRCLLYLLGCVRSSYGVSLGKRRRMRTKLCMVFLRGLEEEGRKEERKRERSIYLRSSTGTWESPGSPTRSLASPSGFRISLSRLHSFIQLEGFGGGGVQGSIG